MKKYPLIFLFWILAQNLEAAVFFEPVVGYAVAGSGKTEFHSSASNADHSYSAFNFGARMGANVAGPLFIGAEYGAQTHALEGSQGAATLNDSVFRTQFGAFANVLYNDFIFYGAYFPLVSLKGRDEDNSATQLYRVSEVADEGSAFNLGVMYRLGKHSSLGLIYRQAHYTKLAISGVESATFSRLKLNDVLISFSFPFVIVK